MQRIAFRLWVKPNKLDGYKEHHKQVWPELLHDLTAAGVRNYSIFADGPELFGYFECEDWDTFNAKMAASDANRRWQAFMSEYLETPVDSDGTRSLRVLEEVFRLD